jgi:hypothetical protein
MIKLFSNSTIEGIECDLYQSDIAGITIYTLSFNSIEDRRAFDNLNIVDITKEQNLLQQTAWTAFKSREIASMLMLLAAPA